MGRRFACPRLGSCTATIKTTTSLTARGCKDLEDPRFRVGRSRARSAPRAQGRGLRHARIHVARAGTRRAGGAPVGPLCARRAVFRDADRAAPVQGLGSGDPARDAAHGALAAPVIGEERLPPRRRKDRAAAARERRAQALPRRPSFAGRAEGAPAFAAEHVLDKEGGTTEAPQAAPGRPAPAAALWVSQNGQAARFSSRMLTRAYPSGNAPPRCRSTHCDLGRAAKPPRSKAKSLANRKLEALERRGRPCVRKSAARSRNSRKKSSVASRSRRYAEEEATARQELTRASSRTRAHRIADQADRATGHACGVRSSRRRNRHGGGPTPMAEDPRGPADRA